MNEGEAFIRSEAPRRGINADIAITVAMSEGGTMPPGLVGKFDTGWSFWQYQLHYGGPDYPQYGTVAGMGNTFTKVTGWKPGDAAAWKDAARYALDHARLYGWGAWYGAAAQGITGYRGIDVNSPWSGTPDAEWDYKTGGGSVPKVTYDRAEPTIAQSADWDCAPTSTRWALIAVGRNPSESWVESTMKADGIVSEADGLLDSSGKALADWITKQYGEFGYYSNNEPRGVSFQFLAEEFMAPNNPYPGLIGGTVWNHWSGLRGYDKTRDVLLLANPAEGWMGVGQTMTRQQFQALGPFSLVRIIHPDLLGTPEPPPPPVDPTPALVAAQLDIIATATAEIRRLTQV